MVKIKPFAGIRPPKELAAEVSSRPYDVLNSKEAKAEAGEKSLLHIIKPEIDFDPIADEHAPEVYKKAVENFAKWRANNWLVQDGEEYYYIYAQTMNGRTQYGLAMCCNYEDYWNGKIKKHELTRVEKEEDRMKHVELQQANLEPVFFAYPDNDEINKIVADWVKNHAADYDFTAAPEGFGHHFWVIRDKKINDRITEIFADIPALYVADGHHRTAAAARVGKKCEEHNPNHTGNEEYCYFLAVTFPASQLKIIDYNRVVKDLNGMTPAEFLKVLGDNFEVEAIGETYTPKKLHNFSLYMDGQWYSLTAKPGTYNDNDPIEVLDVTVLSNRVLDELLDIKDLRTSNRIDFVGGIRGLGELKKRVDSGEMAAAFALYPVSMQQLIDIADTGNIMPPKTTWFEPKLRSGVVIHTFE